MPGWPSASAERTRSGSASVGGLGSLSCGTSTAASLPCMFSPLGRSAYLDQKQPQENLLDVAQRAGLAVLWIDNQAGCKGLCDRVPNSFSAQLPAGAAPMPPGLCDGETAALLVQQILRGHPNVVEDDLAVLEGYAAAHRSRSESSERS